MSLTEIIAELPKLTHQQRRELCQRIIALEAEQEELTASDHAADAGFAVLDQLESEDNPDAGR